MMLKSRNLKLRLVLLASLVLGFSIQAWGQWHIPVISGSAPNTITNLNNDCFRLTSSGGQRGVVWDSTQLDLNQPFDITLSVMQGPWGADGLALVLQRQGLNSWGAGGNGLGYSTSVPAVPAYPSIIPSIAFELDTWDNSGAGVADIAADHVAIHTNGNLATAVAGPVPAMSNSGDITDSICRKFRVRWNPAVDSVEIHFNNQLRMRVRIDIVNTVFSGNTDVWWGITGSSGGVSMSQVVCVGADFANAGQDRFVCPGDTVHLNATGGTQFFWGIGAPLITNQNIPNPVFSSLIPLAYDLGILVTNVAGCTDRDTVRVTVEPFPTAVAGTFAPFCLGDSVQLGGPANPNNSYQWTPATDLSANNVAQPWFVPSTPGNYSYELVATNIAGLAGCTDTATVALTVNDTPSVTIAANPAAICEGQSTTLTATGSGGTGSYTYLWNNGGTAANETVSPSVTSSFDVTVSDGNSCQSSASITVLVNDTPSVSATASPSSICAGQSTTLTATASGGTGSFSYLWSSGGAAASTTVSPLATTTFIVTVSDGNNCPATASVTVTVNVSDSIDIMMPDTYVCNNGSLAIVNTFATSGIDTWSWTPITGVSLSSDPNPVISPAASTTYYLSGLNSSTGCGYTDSIRIDLFQLDLQHWPDSAMCLGDTLQLDLQAAGGSGDYSVLWQQTTSGYISDDTLFNPFISPTQTTLYTATVTDNQTGCETQLNVVMGVSQLNVQASPGQVVINPGQSVQLEAIGAMFYTWSPDTSINCITCPDPVAAPGTSIIYTVLGWDTTGCQGTATVSILVDTFQVPNVFTPNGDGINDVLFFNYHGDAFYEIGIYDRWGKQLFHTKDKNVMWDGKTSGGVAAPEGVYYVAVRIIGDIDIPEKDKQRVFYVTLLR